MVLMDGFFYISRYYDERLKFNLMANPIGAHGCQKPYFSGRPCRLGTGFSRKAKKATWIPVEDIPGLGLWSETERIINLAVEMLELVGESDR